MRREDENYVKRIMTTEVNGRRIQGRQKKRWGDMRHEYLKHEDYYHYDTARHEVYPTKERTHL